MHIIMYYTRQKPPYIITIYGHGGDNIISFSVSPLKDHGRSNNNKDVRGTRVTKSKRRIGTET